MYETESDIEALQTLLDRSFAGAGAHLSEIMVPASRLNARQLVRYLDGVKHVAFATVTSGGEPRVSPLDSTFLWGKFYVGTDGRSFRSRHIRRQPAVSLTHYRGDEVGVIVHGRAELLESGSEELQRVDAIWTAIYGSSPLSWGEQVVFYRIEPQRMFTYAPKASEFPE